MAFVGSVEVTGRDRNDVDAEELAAATMCLMRRCERLPELRSLLDPLRDSSAPPTWLSRSTRFVNSLLDGDRDWFVHALFGYPERALFVSKRTTDSKSPFVRWASAYLAGEGARPHVAGCGRARLCVCVCVCNRRAAAGPLALRAHARAHARNRRAPPRAAGKGAPVHPLDPKANKHLFVEVSEEELEERCVKELVKDDAAAPPSAQAKTLRSAVELVAQFVGLSGRNGFKVHFSSAVGVAFAHGNKAWVPTQPLTRALLVRLLGVIQSKRGYDEAFTFLTQGLFEAMPGPAERPVTAADVSTAIDAAKRARQEANDFMRHGAPSAPQKPAAPARKPHAPSADSDVEELVAAPEPRGGKVPRGGGRSRGDAGDEVAVSGRSDLERKISGALRGKAQGEAILPPGAFDTSVDESEECIRPSSELQACRVAG